MKKYKTTQNGFVIFQKEGAEVAVNPLNMEMAPAYEPQQVDLPVEPTWDCEKRCWEHDKNSNAKVARYLLDWYYSDWDKWNKARNDKSISDSDFPDMNNYRPSIFSVKARKFLITGLILFGCGILFLIATFNPEMKYNAVREFKGAGILFLLLGILIALPPYITYFICYSKIRNEYLSEMRVYKKQKALNESEYQKRVKIHKKTYTTKLYKEVNALLSKDAVFSLYRETKKLEDRIEKVNSHNTVLQSQINELQKEFKQVPNPSKNIQKIFEKNIEVRKLKISLFPLIKDACVKKIKQFNNTIDELEFLEKMQDSNKKANINNDLYENLSNFALESKYATEIEQLLNNLNSQDDKHSLEKAIESINFIVDSEEAFKQILKNDINLNNQIWKELDNSSEISEIKQKINDLVKRTNA